MKRISLFIVLFLFFTACSGRQNTPQSKTPSAQTASRLATAGPGEPYVTGQASIPKGQYLFLEGITDETCSSECNCPPIEPVRSVYGVSPQGELWLDPALTEIPTFRLPASAQPADVLGFLGDRKSQGGGRWHEEMKSIQLLPYDTSLYAAISLLAVDAQGTAILKVNNGTYVFKPGDIWAESEDIQRDSPPGCHMFVSFKFVNHGLLARGQIRVGDPYTFK